ncbi:MAG: hypothetical protein M3Y72_04250 [Acidobacteriota bacterium]|nr:hypothetical protein [Acidobacteriota bacterium]
MLWMKAWLETRWRLSFMLGLAVLEIAMGEQGGGLGTAEHASNLMHLQLMLSIMTAFYLAGSGIKTQSPFRAKRGLHGSTHFTLSMPVSRLRLVAVRASFGFLETAGVVVFMIILAWTLFPLISGSSTFVDLMRLVLAAVVCISCFYCLSVMISTVLDEMWQMYGSLFVAGLAWWATERLGFPSSANVFRFMTEASPLVTHALPWPAMAVSLTLSAVLFVTTLKIVQSHEY